MLSERVKKKFDSTSAGEPDSYRHVNYFLTDLSFIPAEAMNNELRQFQFRELLNPNACHRIEALKAYGEKSAEYKRCLQAEQSYLEFDFIFRNFALDQLEKNNYELAKKCYGYLIELNQNNENDKQYLQRIYESFFGSITGNAP